MSVADTNPDAVKDRLLPIGTLIRFRCTLDEPANEEHPHLVFADKGELGKITGHGCKEGYWVKTSGNPPFGASREEFEVVSHD